MTTCIYSRDLADGLEKLLIDDKYCDFTVTAGGQDFGCHRVILAALSPYFEVMFDTPFMVMSLFHPPFFPIDSRGVGALGLTVFR